jgi:hypothetical protein
LKTGELERLAFNLLTQLPLKVGLQPGEGERGRRGEWENLPSD